MTTTNLMISFVTAFWLIVGMVIVVQKCREIWFNKKVVKMKQARQQKIDNHLYQSRYVHK